MALLLSAVACVWPAPVGAQEPMQMPMPMPGGHEHQMATSMPENPLGIDGTRDASGTSWLPERSPMVGLMRQRGAWMLMLHGNAFLQYIQTGSDRGDRQVGSVNWTMFMAQHALGGGQLQLRTMLSLEPLTVGRCGYPTLLASGEECRGAALHDRQHPHDLFMEIAAQYRHALGQRVALELYGGPAGEPALGPTGFPHRLSAMINPIAPMSHHWLDSTHVSFGVVTGGLYGRKWKTEASLFNGREPDDQRYDIDAGSLDSYSGRLWLMPSASMAIQVSAGHLEAAERDEDGRRLDVDRLTASITAHRLVDNRLFATTVAWGRNRESDQATSALVAETSLDLTAHDVVFGRGEIAQKTAHDLALPLDSHDPFTVAKLQGGYTRWIVRHRGVQAGVGASIGVSLVPDLIKPFYGGRGAGEAAVFFTLRPQAAP